MRETILQFGAGKFLRAFFDRFVHHANEAGQDVGGIVVVQSTPGERASSLNQADGYRILVRGYEDGQLVERLEQIRSVRRALVATQQWSEVLKLADSPDLRVIVSNATEAGYAVDASDQLSSAPPKSLPAKLTQVLYRRYQAKLPPLTMLPCELIERNAEKLRTLVIEQAKNWSLPEAFQTWVRADCVWLTNLVDCIVTNPPADSAQAKSDPTMICAEPYALLAIEKPKGQEASLLTSPYLLWTDDVTPYFLRKVRMLNGLHTAMTAKYFPQGFKTVRQVVEDKSAAKWLRGMLFEEIVPTIAYRADDVAEFADQVWDRFRNPFTEHKLSDIMLHHEEKIRVRLKPTFEEYVKLFGKEPRRLKEIVQPEP